MAPSARRTRTRRSSSTRNPRRTQCKNKLDQSKNEEEISPDLDAGGIVDAAAPGGCSTPKGPRFRIPEILTCPPAPKKQRVLSNCAVRRNPIAFFAPPDIELFFYLALGDIPV